MRDRSLPINDWGSVTGVQLFALLKGRTYLSTIDDFLSQGLEINALKQGIEEKVSPQMIYNLTGSQRPALLAELVKEKSGVVLTYSEEQGRKWVSDLRTWLPQKEVLFFPGMEWLSFEVLGSSREAQAERIRVLNALCQERPCLIVTTVQAVEYRLFQAERWGSYRLKLKCGQQYDLNELVKRLTAAGYERVEVIDAQGQCALRGGILDIAPMDGPAVRIEFFDDEIDSMRIFDPETQRSVKPVDAAVFPPVLEYVVLPEELKMLEQKIQSEGRKATSKLRRAGKEEASARLQEKIERLQEKVGQGIVDRTLYPYLSLLPQPMLSFLSRLPAECLLFLDEPVRLKEQFNFQNRERLEEYTQKLEQGEAFVSPESQLVSYSDVLREEKNRCLLVFSTLTRQAPDISPRLIINQTARPLTGFMGKTGALVEEIQYWQKSGNMVALFAGDQEHGQRLQQGLKDLGVEARIKSLKEEVRRGEVYIYPFSLDQGFELPLGKLVILTEAEIYKRERKNPLKKERPAAERVRVNVSDLKPGDFVVHVHHGIGQFIGIERIAVGGVEKDYFAVKYAGEDRLYVPLDQLHLLQKYLGTDGEHAPKLYKLGGGEWNKVKNKARSAVKELAFDLLKLYAKREAAKGFAFSPDVVWQIEFEEKFPYQETADQLQCIAEVKKDMMRPRPMDRLLCGDVGYGKTEVALRAAFKAVMDNKQVAVLVPTTILAQQHFNTFKERFAGYPVTIEMLSRFRTPKEQKVILEGLKDGSIDLVVGTHRLLSSQVKFKDLGLLIVDEEQRFGVGHKEKLKALKENIDVLTLSATPIPRTLHMAMIGVRDMSVIETPPEDRYPVQTYVAEFRPDLVRDAIRREMQRGGQVFFVHNRIEDMEQAVEFLNKLVPEARVGMAHGRMRETELEREMLSFLEQEKDVLVCTTIIETGLDLPNVNTLIIDESDRLGLAQLYQLRGRVGRSNRKAYAYFLYKPQKVLSEVAEKRLIAIRDFTEFGSGFKIAMRDLEIRGAGDLVGAQQHGHLAAIGFDLYCQMVREAVQELRGEKVEEKIEPSIELQLDAYLPDYYVPDRQSKTQIYQRMALVSDEEALSDLVDELVDRFGAPPAEVENLLELIRLKWKAAALQLEQIQQTQNVIQLKFGNDPGIDGEALMKIAAECPYALTFGTSLNSNLECKIKLKAGEQHGDIIAVTKKILDIFAHNFQLFKKVPQGS